MLNNVSVAPTMTNWMNRIVNFAGSKEYREEKTRRWSSCIGNSHRIPVDIRLDFTEIDKHWMPVIDFEALFHAPILFCNFCCCPTACRRQHQYRLIWWHSYLILKSGRFCSAVSRSYYSGEKMHSQIQL